MTNLAASNPTCPDGTLPEAKATLNRSFVNALVERTPDMARLFFDWYRLNHPKLFHESGAEETCRILTKHPSDGAFWLESLTDTDFSAVTEVLLPAPLSGSQSHRVLALARRFGLYKGCIYVIRLKTSAWNSEVFRLKNLHIAEPLRHETACFYVGQTDLTPENRYAIHSTGMKGASRVARLRCVELDRNRTDSAPLVLALHKNGGHRSARDELKTHEKQTAESIREEGHAAHWG
jgi:hypothetical protein